MAEKVIDRMIKTSSHGCFHIGPISRSRSSSALGYRLGLIIDARAWYTGLYGNSRVITSEYQTGIGLGSQPQVWGCKGIYLFFCGGGLRTNKIWRHLLIYVAMHIVKW